MKATRNQHILLFFLPILAFVILLTSCGKTGVVLAPPDWIQGVWQSELDAVSGDYVVWEFTADSASYEYQNETDGIHTTIDLQTDLLDKWVRDEEDEEERSYTIRIDRSDHYFALDYDDVTEAYDDSTLNYNVYMLFEGKNWVLLKQ